MPYIYKVVNKINQKIYVGKTNFSIEKRWKEHIADYTKRGIESRPLYSAMKKYGVDSFEISLLEECSAEISSEREKFWIESLQSFKYGYNATRGGDGKTYADYPLIISLFRKGKNLREISKLTGYCVDTVRLALISDGITHEERVANAISRHKKPVAKLDSKTSEIIEVFSSVREAGESVGVQGASHISKVCQGKRQTAYGFKWKFL